MSGESEDPPYKTRELVFSEDIETAILYPDDQARIGAKFEVQAEL